MSRVRKEQLIEWANNPPAWKIEGFVTSEEEFKVLRTRVIGERLRILYEMATEELARRQGCDETIDVEETPEAAFDFSELPLKCTLSKRDCHNIAGKLWSEFTDDWYWSQPAALTRWNIVAEASAILAGYGVLASKYSNISYVDYPGCGSMPSRSAEDMFQEALAASERYAEMGFRSPLLMDGIHKIDYASIDLDMVEKDINEFGYAHFSPVAFWRRMIQEKRALDVSRGRETYADVVRTIADGVYMAPYLDETVRQSGRFLTRDDIVAVAIEEGLDFSRGNTLFTYIIDALDTQGITRDTFYEKGWRQTRRPGCVFFDKRLLLDARAAFESGQSHQRLGLLDASIRKYLGDDAVPIDEREIADYKYLVFDSC